MLLPGLYKCPGDLEVPDTCGPLGPLQYPHYRSTQVTCWKLCGQHQLLWSWCHTQPTRSCHSCCPTMKSGYLAPDTHDHCPPLRSGLLLACYLGKEASATGLCKTRYPEVGLGQGEGPSPRATSILGPFLSHSRTLHLY